MNAYVSDGIDILNDVTKDLKDLNELGIYLAKQTDINALKILKLLILVSGAEKIGKYFNIEYINYKNNYSENIVGNLSMNTHNFALELMDYVVRNYLINFDFKCNGMYSVFDVFMWFFNSKKYFNSKSDLIDKKIDMIEFLVLNGLLNEKQIKKLVCIYDVCVNKENNFTEGQIISMKNMLDKILQYEEASQKISDRRGISKIKKEKIRDEIDVIMGISRRPNFEIYDSTIKKSKMELEEYIIENDQCVYMLEEIPKLIKQKVIK